MSDERDQKTAKGEKDTAAELVLAQPAEESDEAEWLRSEKEGSRSSEEDAEDVHTCGVCDRDLKSVWELKDHVQEHHL